MPTTPDAINKLVASYHTNRAAFMQLADNFPLSDVEKMRAFRRTLIAWHEAHELRHLSELDISDQDFLYQASHFFLTHYNPENLAGGQEDAAQYPLYAYLPKPLQLNDRQHVMREQLEDMGDRCQELLILSYYYQLSPEEIVPVMDLGSAIVVKDELKKCNYMVNRRLLASGLYGAETFLSDSDEAFIDRALADALGQDERWDVELRMEKDNFRAAYERRREWLETLRVEGRQHIHQLLTQAEGAYAEQLNLPEIENDESPITVNNIIAVLLILLIGFFAWQWWTQEDQVNLYEQYFQPYPSPGPVTAAGDTLDLRLQRLFATYDRASWQLAYDQMQNEEGQYPILHLYLGISAMALGQQTDAQTWLLRIQARDAYHQIAEWYLALSYLALNDRQQARTQLKVITNAVVHPYRQPALTLLNQLQ